jgi:phage-related protein
VYEIELYKTPSNKELVTNFISTLPLSEQAKIRNLLRLLSDYGPKLTYPYSKKLIGYKNLYELRTSGKMSVRLFYSFKNNVIHVLNAFIKKSNKTPVKEINTAISRFNSLT